MEPGSDAATAEIDASRLCRECGLCCGWSVFRDAALLVDEVAWAMAKRLPLHQDGDELAFPLPCALLEAHGSERLCSAYESRPRACRAFECKVLESYESGAVALADALALVRKARALVDRVEARLTRSRPYESFSSKLRALGEFSVERGAWREQTPDTETLLDLGALRATMRAFYDYDKGKAPLGPPSSELLARATDPSEWDRLLSSVGGDRLAALPAPSSSPGEHVARELLSDGYARLGAILTPEEAAAWASVVSGLAAAGWPAIFVFMHPKAWEIPRRLAPWLAGLLGEDYELLSAVWAWNVARGTSHAGWSPHRDRRSDADAVAADGTPHSLTVWIALTDATPDNGCIHLVPPTSDPLFGVRHQSNRVLDPRSVRAMPAGAGTGLTWNHQVLHWGGRSSPRAAEPRMSLAFEFRRFGKVPGPPALDRRDVPPFRERLRCVAERILEYRHFKSVDDGFVRLAAALVALDADASLESRTRSAT